MRYKAWFGIALVVCLLFLPGFQGGVCHALERHPIDSDKSNGYWCFDCHNFQKNAGKNTKWVKSEILLKTLEGGTALVDYSVPGIFVKELPPYDGVCQACHIATKYYRNDGSGLDHFVGADCLTCHSHFQKNMFTMTLVGSQSHATHLVDATTDKADKKGPGIIECTVCHNAANYTLFGEPGDTIENTIVCDGCHSPDGAFNGVNDPVVGAKPNWVDGIYRSTGKKLQEGKGYWCATCHDNGISMIDGTQAPNVMGDNATYGYDISGHGRNNRNYVECEGCHDLTIRHIDGVHRTYGANSDKPAKSYGKGYRLNDDMAIPRKGEGEAISFTLCTNPACHHTYAEVTDKAITNFRDDIKNLSLHEVHLTQYPSIECWDSDWNGKADSAMSCPACHNVHGSSTPVMIRNGELIGHEQALQFRWYKADKTTLTNRLQDSMFGALECETLPKADVKLGNLALQHNHVCWGCHPVGAENPTLITYKRKPADVAKVKVNEVWTTDLNDTVKDVFARGDAIRFHVRFTIVGEASYLVKSLGKTSRAYNTSGTDWEIKLPKNETLTAVEGYTWTWKDKTIPDTAEAGSTAEVEIQIKLFDAEGVTLLDQNKGTHAFSIQP